MFQYRQVLVRMRQGDTDREIARAGLMGRPKAARLRPRLARRASPAARGRGDRRGPRGCPARPVDHFHRRAVSGARRALGGQ
jgi:hypothetical protein